MITFEQLCNLLTSNGKFGWFYIYKDMLSSFTKEELEQCYIPERQVTDNIGCVQVYWPRERFYRTLQPEHRSRLILEAIEKGDYEEAKKLQIMKGK